MAQSYYKNLTYERVAKLRLSAMYSADYENGQLGRIHRRVLSEQVLKIIQSLQNERIVDYGLGFSRGVL